MGEGGGGETVRKYYIFENNNIIYTYENPTSFECTVKNAVQTSKSDLFMIVELFPFSFNSFYT